MRRKERAKLIQEILNRHFPNPKIPLQHSDSYTLLIAVLLSAQCTDARVNQITPLLFEQADTPEKMLRLPAEKIESIIRPCGLAPKKSKAIWELSKILVEKYNGEVPRTFHELEALPGVGHKTASVVMAQAFHVPAFPVDTHIHRSAKRWGLTKGKTVQETEKDLKNLFKETDWIRLHLQIIYFARKFCTARGHLPENCPICSRLLLTE